MEKKEFEQLEKLTKKLNRDFLILILKYLIFKKIQKLNDQILKNWFWCFVALPLFQFVICCVVLFVAICK